MTDNADLVRHLFLDCFNTGKTERLDVIVAQDYTSGGPEKGPAAFAAVMVNLRGSFPDVVYTIDDLVAAGDRVAVRWTWRGTHLFPFRRHAATGKQIVNGGIGFFQIVDGRIARGWLETDRLGFLQQIGAVDYTP